MSLFIGNVSKKITQSQFQDAFKSFGRCKVDLRKRYAFVQFESDRNAEEAKNHLQNTNFCGLRLNIEWSKNSGRFNQNNRSRNMSSGMMSNRKLRSYSRDRSWRKDDFWYRRSPSREKRSTPTYSENEQFYDKFQCQCQRDQIKKDYQIKQKTYIRRIKKIKLNIMLQSKKKNNKIIPTITIITMKRYN